MNQSQRILPTQAGIGDGFAVDTSADLLTAFFDIALDHNSFYQMLDILAQATAMQNFLGDADLLLKLLVGIGVVRINDAGRILKIQMVIYQLQWRFHEPSGILEDHEILWKQGRN